MEQQKTVELRKAKLNAENYFAMKRFTLSVNIKRYTTDSTGAIIDDALVPVDQRKAYAFHLFNEFDRQGGYAMCDQILREIEDTNLYRAYVAGMNMPQFPFSGGIATINGRIKKGDLIFEYVDDIESPNYFHFVIVSATQGGFASLSSLTNMPQLDEIAPWGAFRIQGFKYAWENNSQLYKPMFMIKTNYKSAYQANPIDPAGYLTPNLKPGINSVNIPYELLLNQFTGLSGYITWENSNLNLAFNIYF